MNYKKPKPVKAKLKPAAKPKGKAKTKPDESELYSISRLAEYYGLDRGTMRTKLAEAGVSPIVDEARKKLFDLQEVETALENTDSEKDEFTLRKLIAETRLKEHELSVEQGLYLPKKEVETYVQNLFGACFQRLAVSLPKQLGKQLFKASTAAQATTILSSSIQGVFNELRRDHRKLLVSD